MDSQPSLRGPLAGRHVVPAGASAGRIVLVHGFTQTSDCWSPVDDDLGRDHELVVVDAPGHGGSAAVRTDLWSAGRAVAEAGGDGVYLGYSMGGRICLHAALAAPAAVTGLVLVSATAGIDDLRERDERRRADEQLADHVVDLGVDAFVDEWLGQPLFATLPADRAHRDARRHNTADGLASSLRLAGTGSQSPLWERLGELTVPVLVVAGALDPKYVALGERLVAGIGAHAELAVLDGAGHTVHLERPDRFLAVLRAWLDRVRHV